MHDIVEQLNQSLAGRYEVEREIGEGGMAWVYAARDVRHDRLVAIKVLKPELAASLGADRFLAEIRTTAKLQHPHILPLFDSGEAGGFLFYVMPYVEGETLRERMAREKQLPVDEAVRIASAVAKALDVAHQRGIIHRDIKPANILLSEGEPLVADFGIAVAVGVASDQRATKTGVAIGTPFYMSPEQASGEQSVGPATDIFALACVLYEMLVGEPPYTGSTAQAILSKILTGTPASSTGIRKTIPIHVDAAIRRGLESVPADRFKSASDFARALSNRSFRHGEWKLGSRRRKEDRWRRVAMLASAAAVILGALAVRNALTPEPAPPVERFVVEAGAGATPALLPDGSGMVFAARDENGRLALWLRTWDTFDPKPISGTQGRLAGTPTLSPDGQSVAYHDDGVLKVVPITGGTPRAIADDASCCTRWAEDGHLYYSAVTTRHIRRVPAEGGTAEDVTPSTGMGGNQGEFELLEGGETALFTVWANPPRLEAIRLSTGERTEVVTGLKSFARPDGNVIFADMQGRLLRAPFDPSAMALTADPTPIVEGISITNRNYPVFSVSTSGTLAYVSADMLAQPTPVWVDMDGHAVPIDPTLSYDPAGNGPLALSLDGSQLAMSIIDSGGRTDIWVMDVTGAQTPRRRITFEAETNDRPAWMPDGRSFLYLRRAPGERAVWERRADGSQAGGMVLDDATHRLLGGEVSRDGRWFVYRRGQEAQELDAGSGMSDVYALELPDGAPRPIVATAFNERAPALSPDARWIAYVSDRSGRDEVYVRPFPNAEEALFQVSLEGGGEPTWAPDGRTIYYRDGELDMIAVRLSEGGGIGITERRTLFSTAAFQANQTGATRSYQIHPDGQRFVMMQDTVPGNVILVQDWATEFERR